MIKRSCFTCQHFFLLKNLMCRRYGYHWDPRFVCFRAEDIILNFEKTILEKHNLILPAISFVLKFILFILKTCFLCLHFLAGCFQIFFLTFSMSTSILPWQVWSVLKLTNRPFYSCVLSCLAIEWKWDWSWPCFDRNLTAFLMLMMLFSC